MRPLSILHFAPLFALSALPACETLKAMDDNSLEAAEVEGLDGQPLDVEGTLSVSAGDEEGDWALAVASSSITYHSPSRVDLSPLSGAEVSLSVREGYSLPPLIVIQDAAGVAFVSSASSGYGGADLFGHAVWAMGDVIGSGEIPTEYEGETQQVHFVDVIVTDDEGEQVVEPGQPTQVLLDGVAYRLTVTTAYEADNPRDSKCGAPDILAVELIRSDEEPGAALQRAAGRRGPVGVCG